MRTAFTHFLQTSEYSNMTLHESSHCKIVSLSFRSRRSIAAEGALRGISQYAG